MFKAVIAIILAQFVSSLAQSACTLSSTSIKENNATTFEGILERKNYPTIHDNRELFPNKISTIWMLRLNQPINIYGSDVEPEICNQSSLQLVLSQEEYSKYRNLLGKKVKVKGQVFAGISAHHYTKALISVEEIKLK